MGGFGGDSLEATRGCGWDLWVILGGAELYMTARRARRRHGNRAGALPRGYFDHTAERMAAREALAVGSESLAAAGAAAAAMG